MQLNELKLTKEDRANIEDLLKDPKFKSFIKVQYNLIEDWKVGSKKRETEFDTVWSLAYFEGKVDGVNQLIDRLESIVTND